MDLSIYLLCSLRKRKSNAREYTRCACNATVSQQPHSDISRI